MSDDLASVTSDISDGNVPQKTVTKMSETAWSSISPLSSFSGPGAVSKQPLLEIYSILSTTQQTHNNSLVLTSGSGGGDVSVTEHSGSAFECTQNTLSGLKSHTEYSHTQEKSTSGTLSITALSVHTTISEPNNNPGEDKSTVCNSMSSSDLRVSVLNQSAGETLKAARDMLRPLQSKTMGELVHRWKADIETEVQMSKVLSTACVGPYHRLYGMSRILARDESMHSVLHVEQIVAVAQFTICLCSVQGESRRVLLVTTKAVSLNTKAVEVWGPWSNFSCGVYFNRYFTASDANVASTVLFNPAEVTYRQ